MSSESSFKSEDSVSDGDSVSDNGEESETERINTKYSKRFDALEDYKEKNTLLSEMSVKDVMNKLDKDEELSTQELETLNRTFRLMDKTIPNDQDSLERMQLYEAFSEIVPSEISENNERIEHHEKKISEYLARLEELKQENSEMSSDNDSSDSNSTIVPNTNNPSNSPGSDDSSNLPGPDNPSGSSGPDDDDDDGFDDFPPSFDFDDF
jgi:predicted RNase H-like nuclease (RuvC/YqgF family)